MLLPWYSREEIKRKTIIFFTGSVFFWDSQKRLLRCSFRLGHQLIHLFEYMLNFLIYCIPKTLRCRIGRMQDWWYAGNEGCRKRGMQEKRDTGTEESRKKGIRTGGIQERWESGLEGSSTGRTYETRDTGNEGSRTGGIQD